MRLIMLLFAVLGTVNLAAPAAWGQNYPSRPIRWVVPFPAGGTTDTNARALTAELDRQMGQSFVVDNRSGANGIIGTDVVAKASPDGHTMLHVSSSITSNPNIYLKLPYDTVKDFVPVTRIATAEGFLLLGSPSLSATTFGEIMARSKKGEKLAFGSPGVGSAMHLGVELMNMQTGMKLLHVPYKGIAPALSGLLSGEVQVALMPPTIAVQQIKTGKVRAIAFAGSERWALMPDLPTLSETVPGLTVRAGWDGVFMPAGVPKEIVMRVRNEIAKAIKVPKVRNMLVNGGYDPTGDTPEEFRKFFLSEIERYRDLARKVGVKPR